MKNIEFPGRCADVSFRTNLPLEHLPSKARAPRFSTSASTTPFPNVSNRAKAVAALSVQYTATMPKDIPLPPRMLSTSNSSV
ncbi:hypothetical protein LshimejAT787_0905240 [Lyophyllum shimeji]|uniref:Uncharacterized protein n=1 Tax=Lyophyllum shimeji TaxID=47721 RepID=A0A9P3PTM7_LYOSH|nr:hypothetical protein LshimejAT787_0905240 [Lyophyllum shimeji]